MKKYTRKEVFDALKETEDKVRETMAVHRHLNLHGLPLMFAFKVFKKDLKREIDDADMLSLEDITDAVMEVVTDLYAADDAEDAEPDTRLKAAAMMTMFGDVMVDHLLEEDEDADMKIAEDKSDFDEDDETEDFIEALAMLAAAADKGNITISIK